MLNGDVGSNNGGRGGVDRSSPQQRQPQQHPSSSVMPPGAPPTAPFAVAPPTMDASPTAAVPTPTAFPGHPAVQMPPQ